MEWKQRRASVSESLKSKFQQKRRNDALARQKCARQAQVKRARELEEQAHASCESKTDEAMGASACHKQTPREFWSTQLMHPEWMVDVPENLISDWYVTPRPEGARCVVVASKGVTTSRARSGMVLHQFQSSLPNGSRSTSSGSGSCVLDCIFHEPDATYYVMDMMVWKGHNMYDCAAEFRLFWVATKLQEDGGTQLIGEEEQTYRFVPLPTVNCTPEGLHFCRSGDVPFTRDGLAFRHKDAHYTPSLAPSPLSLLWKDASTSKYFLDTDASGNVHQHQMVVLEFRMDQTVATSDDPPVVLGKLPQSFVSQMANKLKVGRPVRFSIGAEGIQFEEGQPVGADLRFEGIANPRRGRVDSMSKILFQYQARRCPLTFEMLIDETSSQPPNDNQHEMRE